MAMSSSHCPVIRRGADALLERRWEGAPWRYGESDPVGEWTASAAGGDFTRRAALRPDGGALAYASVVGPGVPMIVVQPVSGNSPEIEFPILNRIVNATLNAIGTRIAAVTRTGTLAVWDAVASAEIARGQDQDHDAIASIAYNSDGTLIATGSSDLTVSLWQAETADPLDPPLGSMPAEPQAVAFNSQGTIVAAADVNGNLQLWDVATRQPLGASFNASQASENSSSITSLAFDADGSVLAAGTGYDVVLWNVATRQMIGEPNAGHFNVIYAVAFSPSASVLASMDDSGQILLWDVSPDGLSRPFLIGSLNGKGNVLAFSPDGTLLAAGDVGGQVGIWDITSRTQLGILASATGPSILSLVFSGDGTELTGLDYNGVVYRWDLSPAAWLQHVCTVANRNLTLAEWQRFIGDPNDPQRPYHKTCPDLPGPTDTGLATPATTSSTPVSA